MRHIRAAASAEAGRIIPTQEPSKTLPRKKRKKTKKQIVTNQTNAQDDEDSFDEEIEESVIITDEERMRALNRLKEKRHQHASMLQTVPAIETWNSADFLTKCSSCGSVILRTDTS